MVRVAEPVPRGRVLAQEQGNGSRGHERGRSSPDAGFREPRGIGRDREAAPAHLARQTQHVEQRRLVAVESPRQHRSFPGAGRELETVEDGDDLAQAVDPGEPRRHRRVLPLEQESHEIRGRDRLDLGAQPIERIAVNARKQGTVAPLERRSAGRGMRGALVRREISTQYHPVTFEHQQCRVCFLISDSKRRARPQSLDR